MSTGVGIAMFVVYIVSVVGLNSLTNHHVDAIRDGLDWTASVSRKDMLGIIRIYTVISYILIVSAVVFKITGFVLYRVRRGDKYTATLLIVLSSINIVIKIAGVIAAISVFAYLGYTDATMQIKFVANILLILAQVVVIVWAGMYLGRLKNNQKKIDQEAI